jgi:NADH dehydrogenase
LITLVIATGMRPSYFGHAEFARYAPGLKNLTDAETIRAKILSAYEWADTTDDENERARQMTFVLVGAGPTGVELAASMAQLAAVTLRGQFRRIDPARSSIILIEGGKRILPTFAERLAQKAGRRLEKLGVRIMTGVKVEKVDENGVVADGKRISKRDSAVDRLFSLKPSEARNSSPRIGCMVAAKSHSKVPMSPATTSCTPRRMLSLPTN